MSSYCNVCRICLSVCREFMDIYEFAPAIMECAPIKIMPDDGHPSVICETCLDKLQAAQHFRVLCIQSDIILRQSNNVVTTVGIPPSYIVDNNDSNRFIGNGMYDYDTNSMESTTQEDNYTHFMSCQLQLPDVESTLIQCDTIIIDDETVNNDNGNKIDTIINNNNNNNNNKKDSIEESSKNNDTTSKIIVDKNNCNNVIKNKKVINRILYKCKKCGKKFPTKFKFRKHHKRLHVKVSLKKCKMCSRPFRNQIKSKIVLNNDSDKLKTARNNYCKYCCKIFSTRSLLWSDSKRHRVTFSCDKCDLTFKSKCHLQKHKEFHRNTTDVFRRILRSYTKKQI